MCIGIPMQVLSTTPGHARCHGRGEARTVRTALVGPVAVGDWLLVFLDSAQTHITAARAREIDTTLDLLQAALAGAPASEAAFSLPSAMAAADLRALVGGTP